MVLAAGRMQLTFDGIYFVLDQLEELLAMGYGQKLMELVKKLPAATQLAVLASARAQRSSRRQFRGIPCSSE